MLPGEVSYCRIQGASWYVGVGPDHVLIDEKQVAKEPGAPRSPFGKWRWKNKGQSGSRSSGRCLTKGAVDEWIESGKK